MMVMPEPLDCDIRPEPGVLFRLYGESQELGDVVGGSVVIQQSFG